MPSFLCPFSRLPASLPLSNFLISFVAISIVYAAFFSTLSLFLQSTTPPLPRYVGPYTTLNPELSFVVEDSEGVCGYVLATLDSSQFYDSFLNDWLPTIIGKYPKPSTDEEQLNPEQVSNIQLCFRGWMSALTCYL